MEAMAKDRKATISQVALAWLLSNPLITSPILGANSVEQLKDNIAAMDIQLTQAENNKLDKASAWKVNEG